MGNKVKTRPCQPGDVVYSECLPCGARGHVVIDAAKEHPTSGVAGEIETVAVLSIVEVPANNEGYVRADLQSDGTVVMGEKIEYLWGRLWLPNDCQYRRRTQRLSGHNLVAMIRDASSMVHDALNAIQGVHDAHHASVASLESRRAASYATWPIRDDVA